VQERLLPAAAVLSPKHALASQITLVALSFILHGRLGRHIPTLETAASPAESGSSRRPPELAGRKAPPVRVRWRLRANRAAPGLARQDDCPTPSNLS